MKKELLKILGEALEGNGPLLVIAKGDNRSMAALEGSMLSMVKMLTDAIKSDSRLLLPFQLVVKYFDEHPPKPNLDEHDCATCPKEGDCPIEPLIKDLRELADQVEKKKEDPAEALIKLFNSLNKDKGYQA